MKNPHTLNSKWVRLSTQTTSYTSTWLHKTNKQGFKNQKTMGLTKKGNTEKELEQGESLEPSNFSSFLILHHLGEFIYTE